MLIRIIRAIFSPSTPVSSPLEGRLAPVESPSFPESVRNGTASKRAGWSKQQSFDPATAKPQPNTKIISGPAYVIDGDTITVRNAQIRLFGIDAPELHHPYGRVAKKAMVKLCSHQTVHAEILETDHHGRSVAKCRLDDGRDLSAELVKQGLALDWPKFSGGIYGRLETPDARKKLWLADARQKGRMYLWYRFDKENGCKTTPEWAPQNQVLARQPGMSSPRCSCPKCGADMVERPNRKTGAKFLGCSKFPKCRGSRSAL